jgi:hypothetical protein
MFCKKYLKVAHAMTDHREAVFSRLRCKQWDCDACSKINAQIWRDHLNARLPEISQTWYLITITARGDTRGHIESFTSIRDNLDRLLKRIRVIWGDIEYVRVYEKHPDSEAVHAHMIMCGLTPFVQNGFTVKHRPQTINVINRKSRHGCWAVKTWFKFACNECGMGFMIDVKEIPVLVAVRYVTKYLTKDLQGLKIRGLRHVQVSDGIGGPEKAGKDLNWVVGAYITAYSTPAGTKMTDLNTGKIIDNDFWEANSFYPNDD